MPQRGRKSSAALAIAAPVYGITRLGPPATLTDAQRTVWLVLVNSRPAEWFGPEHAPLLEQYCRHKVNSDVLAARLQEFDPAWLNEDDGLRRYERLCSLMFKETSAINSLARAMRLTQQSIFNDQRAKTLQNQARGRKPWQRYTAEDDEGGAEYSVDRSASDGTGG
jgi:hypothetical protein